MGGTDCTYALLLVGHLHFYWDPLASFLQLVALLDTAPWLD